MGTALWVALALVLFLIARIVPAGRRQNYLMELVIALTVAILCGIAATALDFGGWRSTDWRALLFVLLGTSAAIGAVRVTTLVRN